MPKNSRCGGKFTGNHTTLTDGAVVVCDIANACATVTKITPGFIKSGIKSSNGGRRVKISQKERVLLLSVRDGRSHQEVFVYAKDLQAAKLAIAEGARKNGFQVTE